MRGRILRTLIGIFEIGRSCPDLDQVSNDLNDIMQKYFTNTEVSMINYRDLLCFFAATPSTYQPNSRLVVVANYTYHSGSAFASIATPENWVSSVTSFYRKCYQQLPYITGNNCQVIDYSPSARSYVV